MATENYQQANKMQRRRKEIAKDDILSKGYRDLPEAPYNMAYSMAAVEMAIEAGYKPVFTSYKNNTARWLSPAGVTIITSTGFYAGAWSIVRCYLLPYTS